MGKRLKKQLRTIVKCFGKYKDDWSCDQAPSNARVVGRSDAHRRSTAKVSPSTWRRTTNQSET